MSDEARTVSWTSRVKSEINRCSTSDSRAFLVARVTICWNNVALEAAMVAEEELDVVPRRPMSLTGGSGIGEAAPKATVALALTGTPAGALG